MERWVEGGPYATVFDAVEDTLTIDTLQGFEFEGLEEYPRVLEPLLFYILHRANAAIRADGARSRLKVFICDEAWRFAKDPTVKAYLVEALKTWRKHNAALILATQSDQDLVEEDLLRAVLDNCPTQGVPGESRLGRGARAGALSFDAARSGLDSRAAPPRSTAPDASRRFDRALAPGR